MKTIKKIIYGKKLEFSVVNDLYLDFLPSVDLYQDHNDEKPDVYVEVSNKLINTESAISHNPAIFSKFDSRSVMNFGSCQVSWERIEAGRVSVYLSINLNQTLRNKLGTLRSMEMPTREEKMVQVLHELVLVPLVYMFSDRMPIHAAVIQSQGETIAFTGTGGVGKSSALLAASKLDTSKFVSDDIAVLGDTGQVYGNMAWPKIYGYNCEDSDIEDVLLEDRNLINRFQFKMKKRINPKLARRKIRPDKLFKRVESGSSQINKMIYLFKSNKTEFEMESLSVESAFELQKNIMLAEYSILNSHIYWDAYNSIVKDREVVFSMETIIDNWEKVFKSAMQDKDIFVLHIPFNKNHKEYLEMVTSYLK